MIFSNNMTFMQMRDQTMMCLYKIRRVNIKAQHSAFSRAINKTVSQGSYMFIKSDVSP